MQPKRILLVRHGRSALVHDGRWMHHRGVREYEDAYDAAGIREDDEPPESLRLAATTATLAASDLPRALASVRRLARDERREISVTPLLRELKLEPPPWIPVRLPIELWDAMSHVQWTYRLLASAEHDTVRRARDAAEWMIRLAASSEGTVLAVTHGGFRRILAPALAARGWKPGVERRQYHNWSVWSFSAP